MCTGVCIFDFERVATYTALTRLIFGDLLGIGHQ